MFGTLTLDRPCALVLATGEVFAGWATNLASYSPTLTQPSGGGAWQVDKMDIFTKYLHCSQTEFSSIEPWRK